MLFLEYLSKDPHISTYITKQEYQGRMPGLGLIPNYDTAVQLALYLGF